MNYHRLLKLTPNLFDGEQYWKIGITDQRSANKTLPHKERLGVAIQVMDRAPYTTTLELEQESFVPLLKKPKVMVRLYHDASMAEIVGWDGHRNWHPHYLYPNEKMYQPDEKLNLNKFLADWLVYCCNHGYFINNKCDGVLVTAK